MPHLPIEALHMKPETRNTNTNTALGHLRVLDLSRVLAGPWCTQMLADLGADVVKVERPGIGDDTRHWGPPFLRDAAGAATAHASYYTACNRNKRSVTIDMARPEGQALIRQMAAQSDVLVENFKVGGLAQYGLDYAALKAINPRLIYCSVTGFGHDGPYAHRAGYDLMIQAMGGMMSITGATEGGPTRVGVAVIDVMTGVYACSAILAAVEARHRSGEGQHIDMALLDVGMAMLANQAAAYLNTGKVPQRQGNSHPSLVPYQDFASADGAILLAIGNDGQFSRFCAVAGHPEWAQDARFVHNADRVAHRQELSALLAAVIRGRSTADWIVALEDQAVPCGPINDLSQAFADPQVRSRGLVVSQDCSPAARAATGVEQIVGVASPLRLQATPPQLARVAPALGEDTDAVLATLGLDPVAIAALRAQGVI